MDPAGRRASNTVPAPVGLVIARQQLTVTQAVRFHPRRVLRSADPMRPGRLTRQHNNVASDTLARMGRGMYSGQHEATSHAGWDSRAGCHRHENFKL